MSPMVIEAQDQVVIRGKILCDVACTNHTFEVLEVSDWICLPLDIKASGQFTIKLAIGDRACLRFEQEGYLTKEVVVDTKHANLTRKAARKNRSLHFDVQMTPLLPDKDLVYAGPVGNISFQEKTGLMKVQFDRSMVQRNRNDLNTPHSETTPHCERVQDLAVWQE